METLEYTTIDKSSWKYAQNEPDKKQWQHENGLACLIVRNPIPGFGFLCGYVGVPENHIYYRKHYNEVDVEVHGGLTFSDFCHEREDNSRGICHISDEKVWWLGFDCGHSDDISPSPNPYKLPFELQHEYGGSYKDFDYVTNEINNLAEQFGKIK